MSATFSACVIVAIRMGSTIDLRFRFRNEANYGGLAGDLVVATIRCNAGAT